MRYNGWKQGEKTLSISEEGDDGFGLSGTHSWDSSAVCRTQSIEFISDKAR